jgi:hypothetical protein
MLYHQSVNIYRGLPDEYKDIHKENQLSAKWDADDSKCFEEKVYVYFEIERKISNKNIDQSFYIRPWLMLLDFYNQM